LSFTHRLPTFIIESIHYTQRIFSEKRRKIKLRENGTKQESEPKSPN
jgi:hypothetical protein